uniref:Uncharacterized protein n=1 Tax=Glossina austeni TaxID=7395 RepID=A0A1A9VEJ5_GLOAU
MDMLSQILNMNAGGAYGGGKAGGAFDPLAFAMKPQVVIRALCWTKIKHRDLRSVLKGLFIEVSEGFVSGCNIKVLQTTTHVSTQQQEQQNNSRHYDYNNMIRSSSNNNSSTTTGTTRSILSTIIQDIIRHKSHCFVVYDGTPSPCPSWPIGPTFTRNVNDNAAPRNTANGIVPENIASGVDLLNLAAPNRFPKLTSARPKILENFYDMHKFLCLRAEVIAIVLCRLRRKIDEKARKILINADLIYAPYVLAYLRTYASI